MDQIHSESMRLDSHADLVTIFIFQGRTRDGISKCLLLFRLLMASSPRIPLKAVEVRSSTIMELDVFSL